VKYLLNILIGVVAVGLLACESSDEDPAVDKVYFPLKTGVYQIYDVEEIIYELGDPDTFHYEIKMAVTDSFPNARNGITYVIHRSKRMEGEASFEYLETWSAESNDQELVVSEENIPYVKLKYPATVGRTWDGNAYNDIVIPSSNQHEDLYTITNQGNSLVLGDLTLGEFVEVEQEDNQEFIVYFDKRIEIYALNVGLVSRKVEQLQYCTNDDCLGDQVVETGIIYTQTITEYGEE
jgi:hypothetical protein